MTKNNTNLVHCSECGGVVTSERACICAGDMDNITPFAYPDSAVLYYRQFNCGLCGDPVNAHVQTETDRYFLECGCGNSEIRYDFEKHKHFFTYAEVGDI